MQRHVLDGFGDEIRDGLIDAIGLRPVDETTRHEVWRAVCDAATLLTELEERVLCFRFGDQRRAVSDVASAMAISTARVKSVEQRALYKLRKLMPYGDLRLIGRADASGWQVQWDTSSLGRRTVASGR